MASIGSDDTVPKVEALSPQVIQENGNAHDIDLESTTPSVEHQSNISTVQIEQKLNVKSENDTKSEGENEVCPKQEQTSPVNSHMDTKTQTRVSL